MTQASFSIRVAAVAFAIGAISPSCAATASPGAERPTFAMASVRPTIAQASADFRQARVDNPSGRPATRPVAFDPWTPLECVQSGTRMVC